MHLVYECNLLGWLISQAQQGSYSVVDGASIHRLGLDCKGLSAD
jgi:hypothetical protein